MPKCPACKKEVYFAEKVTSLGKDWHRPCLKCVKCKKTLTSGGHAEIIQMSQRRSDFRRPFGANINIPRCSSTPNGPQHEGKPYCNNPCYSSMFGPKGFGRGGTESHDYN